MFSHKKLFRAYQFRKAIPPAVLLVWHRFNAIPRPPGIGGYPIGGIACVVRNSAIPSNGSYREKRGSEIAPRALTGNSLWIVSMIIGLWFDNLYTQIVSRSGNLSLRWEKQ